MSFLELLDTLVNIGNGVLEAIKSYNELENHFRAKVFVQFYNYADLTLAGNKNKISSGLTSQLSSYISAGSSQALTLYQNMPLKGVEAVISYSLFGNQRLFVYTGVDQRILGRQENRLGLCIIEADDEDVWDLRWIASMLVGETACLGLHTNFATTPRTLQCCIHDYCVQATMTASNHANITVRVIPRLARHFWLNQSERRSIVNREVIKRILDNPESCFNGDRAVEYQYFSTPAFNYLINHAVNRQSNIIIINLMLIVTFLGC